MTQDRYDGMTTAGRQMVHVPFCLGAIAVFHSVPASEVGDQGLRLSPCVLAKIFSGQITTWDDTEITSTNPGLSVPAGTRIQVGHRTLGSSSTGGLTGYLNAKCPTVWTSAPSSSHTFTAPTGAEFTPVQGSGGMTAHIVGTPYAIGYIDAGHGHQSNLLEVSLQNEANVWLTSMDAINAMDANGNNGVAAAGKAAVDAGDVPSDVTASFATVNLFGKSGTNTWPIVLVSYIYVPKDMSAVAADKVAVLKAFVDMVTGSEGQGMLPDFSFNAVPAAMNKWSDTWANVIVKPTGLQEYTLLSDTTPWTGMGSDIISSKRNSYSMWKLGDLESTVSSMQARLEAMQTQLSDYGIVPLHGSGTTNLKNWFAKAMKIMQSRARVPLLLTYRAVGSSTGQKEFVGDASSQFKSYNHFGAGDIPMSSDRFQTLMTQTPQERMVHIPLALGAIAIFHSVPTDGVALKMDACLLAKVFSGAVTTWDHADIKAQNPSLSVPAGTKIQVAHRTLGSSSTGGLSGYLKKVCPNTWTLEASSTVSWPAINTFHAVEGSPGMLSYIRGNQYAIGYLDAGHGHDYNLGEVALTNSNGQTRTSKESIQLGGVADAGTEAARNGFPTDTSADWSSVNLYDMPGVNTWPIVLVSYMYVKQDQSMTPPKTAAALKAFIEMVVRDTDGLANEFGFTSPSADLRSLSLTAANTITYPAGMKSFTLEESTSPYTGMGANVLSVKRHSYDIYDSDVLNEAISAVRSALDTHDHDDEHNHEATGGSDTAPDNAPLVLSIVSFVISLLASGLGCFAFIKMR